MSAAGPIKATEAQRVDDYLDDQIGEVRDLSRIDALIARVTEQQAVLQSQVSLPSGTCGTGVDHAVAVRCTKCAFRREETG